MANKQVNRSGSVASPPGRIDGASRSPIRPGRYLVAALVAFVFVALSRPAVGQTIQATAGQIRKAMDARDFDQAEALVRGLKAAHPAEFALNNYDYLLARLLERKGTVTEATELYHSVLTRNSPLSQYALWHLAIIARSSGDLAAERQYLTRLLVAHPQSALAAKARERMIDSQLESHEYKAAIALLKPSAGVTGAHGRSAMLRLAQAYARTGEAESARVLFNQLVNGSRDDYALEAAEELDLLDQSTRSKPDEFEALRRARIYLFNRHWAEARTHLQYLADKFPQSPNRPEVLYQTGFTYFREYQYDRAIEWFKRVHEEYPAKKEGEQGFYWIGSSLQQAKRYEPAARNYAEFIDAYPKSDLIEGAYRNVVDSLRYAGKFEEAIEWAHKTTQRFANQPLATVGLYNEAKIELTRGKYDRALQLLTRVEAMPVHAKVISAPIRGEAAFLKIFAIEKMGRIAEATRAYFAIPDERDNYFGQRATERLRALAETDEGRRVIEPIVRGYRTQARAALTGGRYAEAKDSASQALRVTQDASARRELLGVLRECYSKLPTYAAAYRYKLIEIGRPALTSAQKPLADTSHAALANELMAVGLYDEGVTELSLSGLQGARAASADSTLGGDSAYSLAVYSNRGDQAYRAVAFGESASRGLPNDFRVELMPRDLAELIYPAPYRDHFDRYAPKAGVDPRLVLSLARQESRFNPSVKSPAAARGLLQFIPETASKLAEEEGMKNFELDDVYEPEVAVRLAVRYVSDLLKLFPNNPHAVLAAYNTGEQNVERWIARAHTNDVDRLVTEIAIPETKDYVAKVMNSYRAYLELYTPDLKPEKR
ncbi:MAG TPA: transglycosylase SLT domain-containing protein [Blastocatellia bacterium]|nr:transglycosylase SLT domain-containing protein [Blastocatellia bacterium]